MQVSIPYYRKLKKHKRPHNLNTILLTWFVGIYESKIFN